MSHRKRTEQTIHTAINRGFFQQVRFLIELGSDVNGRDSEGRTPITLCAFIEQEEWGVGLARLLIEKGAFVGSRDKKGLNGLHYACIYQRLDLVRVLLNAVDYDINTGDRLGNSALYYAVTVGNADIVRFLILTLRKYKMSVDKSNKQGVTPLIQAWKTGHVVCARMLITEGNANEDARDLIIFKSAKEWEREFLSKIDNLLSSPNSSRSGSSLYSSGYSQQSSIQRVTSAPLLTRRRRLRSATGGRNHGNDPPGGINLPFDLKVDNPLIRSASLTDLRNNPEFVFNVKPSVCFVQHKHVYSHFDHRSGNGVEQYGEGWRREVKSLYGKFAYQSSPSFRVAARPPPPPASDDTPPASETTGSDGPPSDRGSVTSRKGRKINDEKPPPVPKGRRGSVASNASPKMGTSVKGRKGGTMSGAASVESIASTHGTLSRTASRAKIKIGSLKEDDTDVPARPISRNQNHKPTVPVVKETPAPGHRAASHYGQEEDPKFLSPSRASDE